MMAKVNLTGDMKQLVAERGFIRAAASPDQLSARQTPAATDKKVTSLTPIWRIASAILCLCETSTSTCLSFATISSGLCLFLGISVLLDAK
jgi:hypothetical protein